MKCSLPTILVGMLLLFGGLRLGQVASASGGRPEFAGQSELRQHAESRGRAITFPRPRRITHQHKPRDHRQFPNEVIVGLPPEVDQPIPTAPPELLQEIPPALVEQAPPVIPQSSYYWYYCGPGGQSPSSRDHASQYCLGGIKPTVRARPGPGKPFELFEAEEATCRARASGETGTLPGMAASGASEADLASATTVQGRYDISYQRCMVAKGNQILAAPAPPWPSTPLPFLPPPPPSRPPRASAPAY
jgi:hypothetical protein